MSFYLYVSQNLFPQTKNKLSEKHSKNQHINDKIVKVKQTYKKNQSKRLKVIAR